MIKAVLLSLVTFAALGAGVYAVPVNIIPSEQCLGEAAKSAICRDSQPADNPITGNNGLLTTATNIGAIVGGIIAVIVMTISGITMMTSQGNPQKVVEKRNQIIYAVVGLAVIAVARQLVLFVAEKLPGN
jgi:hypothetical protein